MKLDIDINKGVLVDLVRELNEKIDRNTEAVRATNVLLAASAMGENALESLSRSKVLRHLETLESAVSAHG